MAKDAIVIAKKKIRRQMRSTTNETFFHSNSEWLSESVSTNLFSNLSMEEDSRRSMASIEGKDLSTVMTTGGRSFEASALTQLAEAGDGGKIGLIVDPIIYNTYQRSQRGRP